MIVTMCWNVSTLSSRSILPRIYLQSESEFTIKSYKPFDARFTNGALHAILIMFTDIFIITHEFAFDFIYFFNFQTTKYVLLS